MGLLYTTFGVWLGSMIKVYVNAVTKRVPRRGESTHCSRRLSSARRWMHIDFPSFCFASACTSQNRGSISCTVAREGTSSTSCPRLRRSSSTASTTDALRTTSHLSSAWAALRPSPLWRRRPGKHLARVRTGRGQERKRSVGRQDRFSRTEAAALQIRRRDTVSCINMNYSGEQSPAAALL
ncbi:unnamed protein product, partial [Phaeothamnion confervicola]